VQHQPISPEANEETTSEQERTAAEAGAMKALVVVWCYEGSAWFKISDSVRTIESESRSRRRRRRRRRRKYEEDEDEDEEKDQGDEAVEERQQKRWR
jgi:DNA repair photolyase